MMYDFLCNGYGFAGGFWFMWIFWLVILGLIVGLVVWLVNRANRPTISQSPSGVAALDILKKRYARGEITKEEYEDIRKDISQ